MKTIAISLVLCLAYYVSYSCAENLDVGEIDTRYDRLLYRETILRHARPGKNTYMFDFPPRESNLKWNSITAVRVFDEIPHDHGGYARILTGGPGSNHVKIKLKSEVFNGMNFIVEVWGR